MNRFSREALIYALLLASNNRSLNEAPDWSKKILTDDIEKKVSSLLKTITG